MISLLTFGARYDRGVPFFGENVFGMTGFLNLLILSSENNRFLWHDSRYVPRPWDLSSGSSVFFLLVSSLERS